MNFGIGVAILAGVSAICLMVTMATTKPIPRVLPPSIQNAVDHIETKPPQHPPVRDAEIDQKYAARLAKWGYETFESSSNGSSMRMHGYPDPLPSNVEPDDLHIAGQVVAVFNEKTRYQFAYVSTDWADEDVNSRESYVADLTRKRGGTATAYKPVPEKPWIIKDGMLARGEKCPAGRLCFSQWNGDGYDNHDIGPSNPASWVIEQPFGLAYLPADDNGDLRADPTKPWFIVITYYGCPPQISGGWTEVEAKDALPKFQTGRSFGMTGQDNETLNRGNLKEARATQVPVLDGAIRLMDRAYPVRPDTSADPNHVPYHPGMTLMPGQSTTF